MRNLQLRTLHRLDGQKAHSFLLCAGGAGGRTPYKDFGGASKEAEEFGRFLAEEGGEQCGFCSPGFIMNVLAMERELECPTEEEIKEYLAGNLCRCSGYMSQLRAVQKYLNVKAQERKQESKGGNA